jgi:thioredoxin-related protein
MLLRTVKNSLVIVLLGVCFSTAVSAQQQQMQPDAEGSLVKWMTLQEAMEKVQKVPRPIIMDFYTDWCGWCKRMMATTYANPGLAQYINQNFYPVKFNAETKDTIEYLGQKYGPLGVGQRTTNALAVKLLQNKLMYPTTLFMNNFDKQKNDFVFSMLAQGYLDNQKIEPMLVFTLENVFRNCAYEEYKVQFDKAFYDTTLTKTISEFKWLSPKEVFNGVVPRKKKTLVMINTEWCNACKVMKRSTFIDTSVAAYVKEKYDLVDFNPEITDSLTYLGTKFGNPRTAQMPFHQLTFALSKNNFILPTLAVLDENMNLIETVPFYIQPSFLKDIARYYGDDVYKKKAWKDFIEEGRKKTN